MVANRKNLLKKPRFQGLVFAALVLFGGAIVMLADQQAERRKFLEYSDLVYQGVAQRLLTAEGVITALVTFEQDSQADGNVTEGVLQNLVNTYPYIYAIAKLDWVRRHDRDGYEKVMRENGMAGLSIREYDNQQDTFVLAKRRPSYLVTSVLIPMEPQTSQLLGLDLYISKEVQDAVLLAMQENAVSMINVPDFLTTKPGLIMLKNTYYGRLKPETLIESKREINGAVMLYIDQEKMFSSFIEHFPDFNFKLRLLDIELTGKEIAEFAESHDHNKFFFRPTATFDDHRVFRVANRDVMLEVTRVYRPGLMQMLIALTVMFLIAVVLRVWSISRKHQRLAIAKQEESFQALFSERERAEVTLSSITDAVITTDDQDKVTFLNPVAERFMGISNDKAFGQSINDVVHLLDEQSEEEVTNLLETCVSRAIENEGIMSSHLLQMPGEKSPLSVDISCSKLKDIRDKEMGSVIIIRDVTHERELKKQLTYQANHDSLTGLYNRGKFEEEVNKAILTSGDDSLGHVLC
ncbi:MAG: CHASE domain-containing protein, partial [Arenicellales bacterium]